MTQRERKYLRKGKLDSTCFCVSGRNSSFDAAMMDAIKFDELGLYGLSSEIFKTNKKSVKIQSKFNGRGFKFNHTPECDTDSFILAKKIFLNP